MQTNRHNHPCWKMVADGDEDVRFEEDMKKMRDTFLQDKIFDID